MSENKKQHYVPKFYLKFFSIKDEGHHIGLYNKNSKKFVREAGLSGQAYGDFFYGKDGKLEGALSQIEGAFRRILGDIIEKEYFPTLSTKEYRDLLDFTFLQAFRTKARAKQMDAMISGALKQIASHDPRLTDKLNDFEVGLTNGPAMMLSVLAENVKIVSDLHGKLIINSSPIPFITSDHPVVKYNQFLERRKHPGSWTGMASKGLQIFYPISDKYMIVFYDPKIYKYGFKAQNCITTSNSEDINQLNVLQLINCEELLFFNEKVNELYVKNLFEKNKKFIQSSLVSINEHPDKKYPDGSYSTILMVGNENIKSQLSLSFETLTKYAKQYKMSGYAVEVRDETIRGRSR